MKIKVLASGSKGNAVYVETSSCKLLIDCGITHKKICEKLESENKKIDIDGCLITHEHIDHINGLKVFLKYNDIPVYTSNGTKSMINHKFCGLLDRNCITLNNLESIYINNLKVTPFLISHDALEPFGYILEEDNEKVVFLTDSGYVDKKYFELLSNANLYYFESNHDIEMLINSDRPYHLKQRILSDQGHLSNLDSALNFMKICGDNTKKLILAHLSEECNTKECVIHTYTEIFEEHEFNRDVEIFIASQNEVLEVICD